MNDLINREAAAKAIYRALKTPVPDYRKDPFHDTMGLAFAMADETPSAEPESLTDAEQRMFLKAISREKEVCKRIDQDWLSTPFVDGVEPLNLAAICDEIERKVKSALWT